MVVALISMHKMDGVIDNQEDELIALRTKKLKEKLTHEEQERLKEAVAKLIKRIMQEDIDKLFEVKPSKKPVPRKARILESIICQECGEATMESRIRRLFGQSPCIFCFEAVEKRL
jgi:formylmethanofuran dehydrogenase subunit E